MPTQQQSEGKFWQTRYTIIAMCFFSTITVFLDRVNISVAIIPMAKEHGWDISTQGAILSSFYVGYLLMQIGGGRLADRFGGKIVLGLGVLTWSMFTLITPAAALMGIFALYLARIGLGLGEAVAFPSVYSLVTRWFPADEKSKAIALNTSGVPVGTVAALLLTPIIVLHMGWEWAFYLFGFVGIIWCFIWQKLATASPADHPHISEEERKLLLEEAPASDFDTEPPPLSVFLKNGAVWAVIVAYFCGNWTVFVFLSWLPKYVNEGLGVSFAAVGLISMLPHLATFIFVNVAGNVADQLIKRGLDVTFVRKLMQTIGFGGLAISLILIGTVTSLWAAIALLCLSKAFSACTIGGHVVNHLDIGPRYAGTLAGISNTAGSLAGIIGVYLSGVILELTGSWDAVFYLTAGVTIFGLLFYLIFGSGEKQFD